MAQTSTCRALSFPGEHVLPSAPAALKAQTSSRHPGQAFPNRSIAIHTVHTCIRIHTYTYLHIHTCLHAYIHSYMHTYIHTCMHACMHACIHTYIHTDIRTYIHALTCVYIDRSTCMYCDCVDQQAQGTRLGQTADQYVRTRSEETLSWKLSSYGLEIDLVRPRACRYGALLPRTPHIKWGDGTCSLWNVV